MRNFYYTIVLLLFLSILLLVVKKQKEGGGEGFVGDSHPPSKQDGEEVFQDQPKRDFEIRSPRSRSQKDTVSLDEIQKWDEKMAEHPITKVVVVDKLSELQKIVSSMKKLGRGEETKRPLISWSEARQRLIFECGIPFSISSVPNQVYVGEDFFFFAEFGKPDFSNGFALSKNDGSVFQWKFQTQ